MKYLKKSVLFATCLTTMLSVVAPAFYAVAENKENEETAVSYDEEMMAISLDDDEYVVETNPDTDEEDTTESNEEQTFVLGDYSYTINSDGDARITDCSLSEGELVIPDKLNGISVAEIDTSAFFEKNYTKIHIPATVTNISEENPFASLVCLEEIIVDDENKNYTSVDGILYSKDKKTLLCYPIAKKGTSFTIPDGVEELGIAAISGTSLTEIKLPSSLARLNRHCFSYNESLTSIDMSGTAIEETSIMAFVNCTSLKDVKFSDKTTNIGVACFMDCKSLEDVELPPALVSVGQSAFQDTAMKQIIIPDTVTSIGFNAFGYKDDYNAETDFTIIGSYSSAAYKYAKDYDEENDYQNDFNFMTLDLYEKKLEYEKLGVVTFGDFAYAEIDGEGCLMNCTSISDSVNVPSAINGITITSVYYGAFLSCGSKTINLPDTIKTIGENAFSSIVENITISGGCTKIEGDEPFISCKSLKSITVTDGDGEYCSEDGVLYNKDKTKLICYPQAKEDENFNVPKSVKELAMSAFCYNGYIKKADISSVETIGDYAFEGCLALEEAKLSKKLKSVGTDAFLDCRAMKSIRIYSNVDTIEGYAFGYYYDEEAAADIEENYETYAAMGDSSALEPYSIVDGFKIYTDKDSIAYQYAIDCNIDVITDTVAIGGTNVQKNFLYAVGGGILVLVLIIVGIFTGKKIKKKKKSKKSSPKKDKAEEKNTEDDTNEK